ncbi:MAG: hypothetical protein ACOYL6_08980 [Bacteriovoracaceae bacterium]
MPLLISTLLIATLDINFIITTVYLLIALLFYRLFDDVMMEKYDRSQHKTSAYLNHIPELKKLLILPLGLYLTLTFIIFGLASTLLTSGFLAINLALYHLLKETKLSLFISILKYLFLGYICLSQMTIWIMVCFALFLFHELVSEKFLPLPKVLSFSLFFITIGLRLFWSYQ